MAVTNESFLDAPIPGQSLTAEPKSRPWRRPAEATNVDDAVALYAPMFQDKTTTRLMLEQIENGIPLTSIADILITGNAMEGRHSLDVGILVAPILVETMATFADMAGIDYVVGNEERDTPETNEEIVRRAVSAVKKVKGEEGPIEEEQEMTMTEDAEIEMEQPQTGLMARRSAM